MVASVTTERFSQIGGHRALDLVNTVHWRLAPDRRLESLVDYADVLRWSLQLGCLTPADMDAVTSQARRHPERAAAAVDAVRSLRENLYAVLYENADPAPIVDAYRDAIAQAALAPSPAQWTWEFPTDLNLPLRRMALDAVELLTDDRRAPLSQCQDADCGWVFLDTSPRHNRRWCVSADCGNRNRVRDYYNRGRQRAEQSL